jgi:hypothetical protein
MHLAFRALYQAGHTTSKLVPSAWQLVLGTWYQISGGGTNVSVSCPRYLVLATSCVKMLRVEA